MIKFAIGFFTQWSLFWIKIFEAFQYLYVLIVISMIMQHAVTHSAFPLCLVNFGAYTDSVQSMFTNLQESMWKETLFCWYNTDIDSVFADVIVILT
jgi:hypothetical protein